MDRGLSLLDVVRRVERPAPWAEGDNIPWDDPEFSRRMLAEHLSQEHDLASRRTETIERHVQWIHETVLGGRPTRILDLACGPGLYTSRLARMGHECVGIDFGPAAIEHAREQAGREGLACEYVEADVRTADLGGGFGLVMMLYGQINVFQRDEARSILSRAWAALDDGGVLLLEPQTEEQVRRAGAAGPSWYTSPAGLFSGRPHLVLKESFWDEAERMATERFYAIDTATAEVTRCALSSVAYRRDELVSMLSEAGFQDVDVRESLAGADDGTDTGTFVVVGRA